jgi:acetyltransferase EpsM
LIKKKVIILGAGGNANVIRSTINDINEDSDKIEFLGFLDDRNDVRKNQLIKGKITKKNIDKFKKFKDVFFIWSLRSTDLGEGILKKYKVLNIEQKKLLTVIHPTAVISKYSKIGYGVTIHPFVNVSTNVVIKNNVHIFSHSMIGHDTNLDHFSYVANNVSMGAFIKLNQGGYLGMNSTIRERVKIGKWSIVGMGSVVINNVKNFSVVVGNPATQLKK